MFRRFDVFFCHAICLLPRLPYFTAIYIYAAALRQFDVICRFSIFCCFSLMIAFSAFFAALLPLVTITLTPLVYYAIYAELMLTHYAI